MIQSASFHRKEGKKHEESMVKKNKDPLKIHFCNLMTCPRSPLLQSIATMSVMSVMSHWKSQVLDWQKRQRELKLCFISSGNSAMEPTTLKAQI